MQFSQGNQFHVGLIGDGVRRWARSHQVELLDAYQAAMNHVALFIDFFFGNGANIISLYLLSKENLGREPGDLQAAIRGETDFLQTILYDLVKKWNCSVQHAGIPELLPSNYLEAIQDLIQISNSNEKKMYLLAAYNPFDEVYQAQEKGHKDFWNYLWVREPVDLVIRTSGEYRTSNFLPLQIGYAELYFLEKHINDLEVEDCQSVLNDFLYKRTRRFGM